MLCSRPDRSSRFLLSLAVLALLGLSAVGATTSALAATVQQSGSTRAQRPLADDPGVDQSLVAQAPVTPPASPASMGNGGTKSAEAEYQIAAVAPADRPPRPIFAPLWPTSGTITTYFGEVGPYSQRGHAGLDIANSTGTPILAADGGEVLKAYWDEEGYGGLIVIGHPSGFETWYGHLSRIGVDKGQRVARSDQIGLMGSTGYSTGPHLHFEVRQEGALRDPLLFLSEAALKSAAR
jgi:murein DD-endopeptidase MepM/ murein hydrolase activator NlpD